MATPRRVRIALLGVTHPFRGGIAHYTTLLCRHLRKKHDVTFISLSRQYPGLLFPGVTQQDHSGEEISEDHDACLDSLNPATWFRAYRRIRAFAPELLVISWWHPFFAPSFGTVARLAHRFAGIPCLFLCHNVRPHEDSVLDRALLKYAWSRDAGFIVHSQRDRAELLALMPDARVLVSPHPTYETFGDRGVMTRDEARRTLAMERRRVVLFFGFIRAYKGLEFLLEAVLQLPLQDDYHLLVVGEWYEGREAYGDQMARLSARGQLTIVDRYVANEEVPLYFQAADLVVVPYVSASQSGVVQIAYGFGKPVVGTTVGGLPEAIRDGKTGFLVPPCDPPALAGAIRRYFEAEDPESFRKEIAADRDRYSWDRMVEAIESYI
ncbi:MAG: glycosyltransferase [Candidatus Hydrogenedentota bacterium]